MFSVAHFARVPVRCSSYFLRILVWAEVCADIGTVEVDRKRTSVATAYGEYPGSCLFGDKVVFCLKKPGVSAKIVCGRYSSIDTTVDGGSAVLTCLSVDVTFWSTSWPENV